MARFTGFFKSAADNGIYIGALKGDGFEVVLETRTPEAAEVCLRAAFPVEKTAATLLPSDTGEKE